MMANEMPGPPKWMFETFRRKLRDLMVWSEGDEDHLYRDTKGNWTGGIGWNFSARGLPGWAISGLYWQAINEAVADLDAHIPWWRGLDDVRQRALINLCFNMGWPRLSGFVHMLGALRQHDFAEAGRQLIDSDWWNEVGRRGPVIRDMIETGQDPEVLPE